MKNRKVLRPAKVAEKLGIARATLYLWKKREGFPQQVVVGPRAVGWYEDELESWLEQQARANKTGREARPGRPRTASAPRPQKPERRSRTSSRQEADRERVMVGHVISAAANDENWLRRKKSKGWVDVVESLRSARPPQRRKGATINLTPRSVTKR